GRLRKGEVFELTTGYRTVRSIAHLRRQKREGLGPDLQVDLSGGFSSALLRHLTGSGSSAARGAAGLIGLPGPFLRQSSELHLAHEYLRRLEPLGVRPVVATPELTTNPEADLRTEKMLRRLGIESGHLLIGLHPGHGSGAGTEAENGWPLDRFVALGKRLIQQFDARLLILAGPGEEHRRSASSPRCRGKRRSGLNVFRSSTFSP
ncbi:MAG: glycosyltransferase family 9 protein, partial [Acidobacteriota bacterium]